jgi:hypothetical protein
MIPSAGWWALWLFAHEPGFGWLTAARWRIEPTGQFTPENADLIGGVDADPHPVPLDLDYRNGDAAADDDLLAGLPAQNQHGTPP